MILKNMLWELFITLLYRSYIVTIALSYYIIAINSTANCAEITLDNNIIIVSTEICVEPKAGINYNKNDYYVHMNMHLNEFTTSNVIVHNINKYLNNRLMQIHCVNYFFDINTLNVIKSTESDIINSIPLAVYLIENGIALNELRLNMQLNISENGNEKQLFCDYSVFQNNEKKCTDSNTNEISIVGKTIIMNINNERKKGTIKYLLNYIINYIDNIALVNCTEQKEYQPSTCFVEINNYK